MPENTDLPADYVEDEAVDESEQEAERTELEDRLSQVQADVDLYRADDDLKEAIREAEATQADANPTAQTYDKSVGLDSDSDDPRLPEYPDFGAVVPQGGVPEWRTDGDTEYADREVVQGSQLRLHAEQSPVVPVEPGDGPDAGSVVRPAPEGPSIVGGKKDTVPKDRQRPAMSLQEQVERGIGTPSPFPYTPPEPD